MFRKTPLVIRNWKIIKNLLSKWGKIKLIIHICWSHLDLYSRKTMVTSCNKELDNGIGRLPDLAATVQETVPQFLASSIIKEVQCLVSEKILNKNSLFSHKSVNLNKDPYSNNLTGLSTKPKTKIWFRNKTWTIYLKKSFSKCGTNYWSQIITASCSFKLFTICIKGNFVNLSLKKLKTSNLTVRLSNL